MFVLTCDSSLSSHLSSSYSAGESSQPRTSAQSNQRPGETEKTRIKLAICQNGEDD